MVNFKCEVIVSLILVPFNYLRVVFLNLFREFKENMGVLELGISVDRSGYKEVQFSSLPEFPQKKFPPKLLLALRAS